MNKKQRFIGGLIDIGQGLAKVLTLGYINVPWAYQYAKYLMFKEKR